MRHCLAWTSSLLLAAALGACADDPDSPTGGAGPQDLGGGGTGGSGGTSADGGEGGVGGAGDDSWLDAAWPTSAGDPVAAGANVFDPSLEYVWTLPLGSGDEVCPATDCPGGAPDPILGSGYEVTYYSGGAQLGLPIAEQFMMRSFFGQKASYSKDGGPDIGRGVVADVIRRACDGALLVLSDSDLVVDGEQILREDFGSFAVGADDAGTRIVLAPPPLSLDSLFTEADRQGATVQLAFEAGGALVFRTAGPSIESTGFAFRAEVQEPSDRLVPSDLELELADPTTTTNRILEIYELLDAMSAFPLVVALEQLAHHPSPEVRSAALSHVAPAYLDPNNLLNRRYMDDRMMAQLLYDPSPEVRLEAVQAQATIRASWYAYDYHCSVASALERCRAADPDDAVRAACDGVLADAPPTFGNCTLDWP